MRQARDAADILCPLFLQSGEEQPLCPAGKVSPVGQHIEHDDRREDDVHHRRDRRPGDVHHRADQRARAGERPVDHGFPVERGDALGELARVHAVV